MNIDGVDYTAEANLIKTHIKELDTAGKSEVSFSGGLINSVEAKRKGHIAYSLNFYDYTFPHEIYYDSETDQFTVKLRQNIE